MKPIPVRPDYSAARSRPALYLERAAYAQALAAFTPGRTALEIAREHWSDDNSTPKLITKAAVNPASRGTAAWAGNLAADATTDFVASLAPESAFARLCNAGMKVDLAGLDSIKVPRRQSGAKPATTVSWIVEGNPIPVKDYALDTVSIGPARRLAMISVLSREIIVHANGQQTVSTLLREDAAASLDAYGFSATAAVADTSPGGLLAGITPISAAAGGGDTAMYTDLEKLAGAICDAGGGGSMVYVMASRQAYAARLRLRNLDDVVIWPSANLTAGTIIAVEASAFVSFVSPQPDITAGSDGMLHLNTVPLAGLTGSPVRSLFQEDLIALRCQIEISYAMRAPMIAVVNSATWGTAT
jgi:hypothetical protein